MDSAPQPRDYDLVLVFTAFQRNCVYLSIIRELSKRVRIAVLPIVRDARTESRIGNTNRQFLRLCASFGADVVSDRQISARVEILAQSNYRKQDIEWIGSRVRARKTFWLAGVAMGNASYRNLHGKKIDRVLVPDRRLYDYRIKEYGNDGVDFPENMIVEVGIPYSKYPVFEPLKGVDYILANPTPFSFVTLQDRLDYLEHVLSLLQGISERGETVAFKPHNADERADYLVDKTIDKVLRQRFLGPFLKAIDTIAQPLAQISPIGSVRNFFTECLIGVAYRKVMSIVTPLSEFTPYPNLNLELFLPDVSKGLITGRSNSIWHGLYLKKPVWNCIDEDKPYFSDTKMHKYAMKYLGVHGNYQSLYFDESLFDVVGNSTREADLIEYLGSELGQN